MAEKEIMKYGLLTGVAALVTPWLLPQISKVLSTGGLLDVDLQSVASIKVTGLGTTINTGLSKYAAQLLSVLPVQFTAPDWAMLFVGGFLFGVVGYFGLQLVEKALKITSPTLKLTTVLVTASILTSMILAMQFALPGFAAFGALAVTSLIFAGLAQTVMYLLGVENRF